MIVLDASAALAYLLAEPGAALVRQNLGSGVITTVNLIEVCRRLRRGLSQPQVDAVKSSLVGRLKAVEDVKQDDVSTASEIYFNFQKSHGISLGDAVCLAAGLRLNAEVWTTDAVWGSLPNAGKVRVIR